MSEEREGILNLMDKFKTPVRMADETYATLQLAPFSQGDIDCDECGITIYAGRLRWLVEHDHGVVKRYHYWCYQPIVKP